MAITKHQEATRKPAPAVLLLLLLALLALSSCEPAAHPVVTTPSAPAIPPPVTPLASASPQPSVSPPAPPAPSADEPEDDQTPPSGLQMGGGLLIHLHDCDDATSCTGNLDDSLEKAFASAAEGVARECAKMARPGRPLDVQLRVPSFGETCWVDVPGPVAKTPFAICVAARLRAVLDGDALEERRPNECASLEIRIDRGRARIDDSKPSKR